MNPGCYPRWTDPTSEFWLESGAKGGRKQNRKQKHRPIGWQKESEKPSWLRIWKVTSLSREFAACWDLWRVILVLLLENRPTSFFHTLVFCNCSFIVCMLMGWNPNSVGYITVYSSTWSTKFWQLRLLGVVFMLWNKYSAYSNPCLDHDSKILCFISQA